MTERTNRSRIYSVRWTRKKNATASGPSNPAKAAKFRNTPSRKPRRINLARRSNHRKTIPAEYALPCLTRIEDSPAVRAAALAITRPIRSPRRGSKFQDVAANWKPRPKFRRRIFSGDSVAPEFSRKRQDGALQKAYIPARKVPAAGRAPFPRNVAAAHALAARGFRNGTTGK